MVLQKQIKLSDYYVKKNDNTANKNIATDNNGSVVFEDKNNHTHDQYAQTSQAELKTNKSTSITSDTGSTTKYPSVKAVEDYAQQKDNYPTVSDLETVAFSGSYNDLSDKPDIGLKIKYIGDYTVEELIADYGDESGASFEYLLDDIGITLTEGIIYLLPYNDDSNHNEYIYVHDETSDTFIMELLGTTATNVDLSDYLTTSVAALTYQPKGNYLTSHQDITGKEDKTNKKNEIPTDVISPSENVYYPTMSAVRNYAQPKGNYVTTSDSRLSDARTPKTHSHGNITNDGKVGTDSDKIITTGTGGLLQASSSISKSMINDFPSAMTPTSHEHSTTEIKDNSAYTNIGSSANSTQKTINDKINIAIGLKADSNNVYSKNETYTQSEITTAISNAVSNLQLFEVVNSLPTSNIKTNRLYLIVNGESITNNSYDIYLRVNNAWEQLDKLEFDVSNFYNKTEVDTLLNGKVDTSDSRLTNARTPTSHTHGNITNTGTLSGKSKNVVTDSDGNITTEDKLPIPTKTSDLTNDSGFLTSHDISGKAPTDHASVYTTYGVGSSNNYGHVKVANNLTTSSFDSSQPVVLSAYQGNLLNTKINNMGNNIIFYEITSSNYSPNIDSSVTITVKAVRYNGDIVPSCPFTLNANGSNIELTTNSEGIATYSYTCSSWGLHTFSVSDNSIQINVKGWKQYRNDNNYKVYYNDEYVWFRFDISGVNASTNWTELGANVFPDAFVRPSTNVFFFIGMNGFIGNVRPDSPKFRYKSQTSSGNNNFTFTGEVMWRRK